MMNAVVLTVKASYVASTKYKKLETKVLMQLPSGIAAIIYFQMTLLPSYISMLLWQTTSTENWRTWCYICCCKNNNLFAIFTEESLGYNIIPAGIFEI